MKTVLITGANRGLGLEFAHQYAEAGWRVLATCRQPASAGALKALAEQYPQLSVQALDVADFAQIDQLATRLRGERIDVLLNNAGVYDDAPRQGFGKLDYSRWQDSLTINTLAPVKMAEAFMPQLLSGGDKLIVAVSSLMGSMAHNTSGGSLLYRSSKAALNAAMKSLSIDLQPRSVGVMILHPGWVRTDMGGPNGLIDVAESVSGMRRQIAEFSLKQSGSFVKYDGAALPW